MSPGNYHANLCITSNDPAKPLSVVPVEMEVVQPCLSVDPEALKRAYGLIRPGLKLCTLSIFVKNQLISRS